MDAPSDNTTSKSYLSETLNNLSPWSSRSTTPKMVQEKSGEAGAAGKGSAAAPPVKRGGDHRVSHRHRLSLKSYPKDCPKLDVQWFHAIDVPKRKPDYVNSTIEGNKPPMQPKKWNPFSTKDSRQLEAVYQGLADEEDKLELSRQQAEDASGDISLGSDDASNTTAKPAQASQNDRKKGSAVTVAVNEDYLFDVDVKHRELGPAYWVGPIYEVRRGTWFDGSTLKPCEENLATQLEEGYLRTQPWRQVPHGQRSAPNTRPTSGTYDDPVDLTEANKASASSSKPTDSGSEDSKTPADGSKPKAQQRARNGSAAAVAHQTVLTHRLFGSYMNQVATYQDPSTAWVLSDDFLSRMSSAMFQRWIGGAGSKYIRGYSEAAKKKIPMDSKRPSTPPKNEPNTGKEVSQTAASNQIQSSVTEPTNENGDSLSRQRSSHDHEQESRMRSIERQMSSLVSSADANDPSKQDEETRRREEREIQDDYRDDSGDAQDRDIEHLILVTHGIGQRLGARFESFNFIHDVNEFRKTLKAVYKNSPDLQALNSEVDQSQKNCRIQVLPICWRHLLDFPQQGIKHNRREHDIADLDTEDEDEYPGLEAITVEGVPALRNIVSDLALDILLYQTPAYKDHIYRIVVKECNRILKLFKKRNPTFNGKVSLLGHSLGSAIMFDVLSDQEKEKPAFERRQRHATPQSPGGVQLDFDVDSFFCFGSPIGLFQMLKGRTIAGRTNPNRVTLDGGPDSLEDPLHDKPPSKLPVNVLTHSQHDAMVSSPKCRQFFNIFHPTDPISYRIEPLISPAMTSMRPQALPYTKNNFFGAPMGQGFTGIPARVGQSFTGMWSNFTGSLTSSFINRSLGISAEDAAKMTATPTTATASTQGRSQQIQGAGAGTNIVAGGVIPPNVSIESTEPDSKKRPHGKSESSGNPKEARSPPTLIDAEMDTLYAGFQKRRKSEQDNDTNSRDLGETPMWKEAEERARKLRREEAKVRALNTNGRVDYSIQEGAFDISFLASVASHLAYWTDEDVSHFMTSQLLSGQRRIRTSRSSPSLR
ncbi:MAG: hypothetical protein M1831_001144 [Alyxoria varia]|nr:MAG: hypothetical protein M1831_001144 [Alyxoria varia]